MNVPARAVIPTVPEPLVRMLEARSVAVVGASSRPGSFGERLMLELIEGGTTATIYPVNPRYREMFGHPCYPSVEHLPEPVDLAILGVANERLEEQLRMAVATGAGSAVVFASGYELPRDDAPPLTERLARMARDAGMALCGGNCMGFVHVERRLRACGYYEPKDRLPGPITFLTHSGGAFSAMLNNRRAIEFNLVVSAGQELVTTVADYMRYALEQESTRVVALFLEAVRDPDGFTAALQLAARRDVPVIALKTGREERARDMVVAHSGALAGEDGAYEALFDAYGVMRVHSLDELADTITLFASGRRAGPGGLATLHDSGGERPLLIDAAGSVGIRFAEISETTRRRLEAHLEEDLPPVNPLDAWGTGHDADVIYRECARALIEDPDTAGFAFVVDLTAAIDPRMLYTDLALRVFPETDKPFAVLSNFAGGIDEAAARMLREAGVPVLEGTLSGLAAFRHLFAYRDFRARPPAQPEPGPSPDVVERWRARLARAEPVTELEALELLAEFGIAAVPAREARSLEEAAAAADAIGYPVALKTAVRGVSHKSDVGGVKLDLNGPEPLADAYRDLAERLGPDVLVAPMAPPGLELALGVVRDPQFGPLVMVAAGGLLVEVLRDRRFALPPVDRSGARALLDRLEIRPLMEGVRGSPPVDLDAVAVAVARLAVLASALAEHLEALDINPLIAGPEGCMAVDALVVPRRN